MGYKTKWKHYDWNIIFINSIIFAFVVLCVKTCCKCEKVPFAVINDSPLRYPFLLILFRFSSNIFERVLTTLQKISSAKSVWSLHFSTRKNLIVVGIFAHHSFIYCISKAFYYMPNTHRVLYSITLKVYIVNRYKILHSFTRKLSLCHLSLFEWLWCLKKKKKHIIYW